MPARLYVGTRKGMFVWSKGSAGKWNIDEVAFLGEPITMLLPRSSTGATYAVLTLEHFGTKLRRREAGGSEWEEMGVPVYPEGAEVPIRSFEENAPTQMKPASLSEIWALEEGEPGVLWAGTIPGGLFRSKDGGATWEIIEGLWNVPERKGMFGGGKDDPGIHSIAIDPRDKRSLSIAISAGGVWKTNDNGATWSAEYTGMRQEYVPPNLAYAPAVQDVHRLVRCPSDPDAMWVQHHNGIFSSTDGGATWTEITSAQPSGFGFAVAVHPHDPTTAWFVPAKIDQVRVPVDGKFVASRTRDGGKSFEVLTRGLPGEHAYDLVYRHALDVDETGNLLAMGSTTGGLWVTENGGDDWTCLSHTLPPIYCVRIGA